MVLATIISGAGATPQQDGWHACGPECCFGALRREMSSFANTLTRSSSSLFADHGFRRGRQVPWRIRHSLEVEPLDRNMTFITFGEGRRIPAVGAAGAVSKLVDAKVGRIEVKRSGKVTRSART